MRKNLSFENRSGSVRKLNVSPIEEADAATAPRTVNVYKCQKHSIEILRHYIDVWI